MLVNGMRPIHPGEILREEYLEPLGMSANALAGALNLTAARVNEIVREKRGITPDTALRLSRYFSTTAEFWLNLQMMYELRKTIEAEGKTIIDTIRPREMEAA
jgi:addiction module HigA family antidote